MLVVETTAARYEAEDAALSHEEHLLERVSALENRLARVTDRLEQTLDLLLKQAHNAYFDHALIETLIGVLSEDGTIEAENLREQWQERCQKDAAEQDESERRESLRRQIIARYRGPESAAFVRCINEGMDLLDAGEIARGTHWLERAARMSTDNAPLFGFLGEHFFRSGKMTQARDYLARAYETAPEDDGLCLLLGLACGDEGETERARELLNTAAQKGRALFAAHYGLGRLFAAEQRWTEAITEFKLALVAKPSPEAHYVLGSAYYQLGRDRMAARHLRKAVELDANYAAAYYMLGLVYLRAGERERARESFKAARATSQDEPLYRAAARQLSRAEDAPAVSPLFKSRRRAGRKHLLMSGDERLAEAVREDALALMPGGEG